MHLISSPPPFAPFQTTAGFALLADIFSYLTLFFDFFPQGNVLPGPRLRFHLVENMTYAYNLPFSLVFVTHITGETKIRNQTDIYFLEHSK